MSCRSLACTVHYAVIVPQASLQKQAFLVLRMQGLCGKGKNIHFRGAKGKGLNKTLLKFGVRNGSAKVRLLSSCEMV